MVDAHLLDDDPGEGVGFVDRVLELFRSENLDVDRVEDAEQSAADGVGARAAGARSASDDKDVEIALFVRGTDGVGAEDADGDRVAGCGDATRDAGDVVFSEHRQQNSVDCVVDNQQNVLHLRGIEDLLTIERCGDAAGKRGRGDGQHDGLRGDDGRRVGG